MINWFIDLFIHSFPHSLTDRINDIFRNISSLFLTDVNVNLIMLDFVPGAASASWILLEPRLRLIT